jgi:hypothetical protein
MNPTSDAPRISVQPRNSANEAEGFQHAPLDHTKPSIRLVKVLRGRSQDGLLHCTICHTTTMVSRWNCLSYTWGEPDPSTNELIILNGYRFIVRRNLYDFLCCLQLPRNRRMKELSHQFYWIDALCIDQENDAERNHQVEHMGQIFAEAVMVHIWLGATPKADGIVDLLRTQSEGALWDVNYDRYGDDLSRYVFKNKYWNRAWVTQEVVLAKMVMVSLGDQVFHYSELFNNATDFRRHRSEVAFEQFDFGATQDKDDLIGSSLLHLLCYFRARECAVLNDRVYSLLAVCGERYRVPVDYSDSPIDLALQVFGNHSDPLCICAIITFVNSLGLCASPSTSQSQGTASSRLCLEFDAIGFGCRRYQKRILALHPHKEWITCFTSPFPPNSIWGNCLAAWSLYFLKILASNKILDEQICTSYARSSSEFPLHAMIKQRQSWFELAPGWKIKAHGREDDVCVVRVDIAVLCKWKDYRGLCSTFRYNRYPGKWIRAMRVIYNE